MLQKPRWLNGNQKLRALCLLSLYTALASGRSSHSSPWLLTVRWREGHHNHHDQRQAAALAGGAGSGRGLPRLRLHRAHCEEAAVRERWVCMDTPSPHKHLERSQSPDTNQYLINTTPCTDYSNTRVKACGMFFWCLKCTQAQFELWYPR